jgi:diguanylate cyclase (GGDEF)-like protein/PAS domain S-box-containing protein
VTLELDRILDASRDLICVVNRDQVCEFANESWHRAWGLRPATAAGKPLREVCPEEPFTSRLRAAVERCFDGEEVVGLHRLSLSDGVRYFQVACSPCVDRDRVTHVVIQTHDHTQARQLEARLLDFEFRDATTGLFNRRSFQIVLDMELEKARRQGEQARLALLLVGLRNLDAVNAQYGYDTGDLLLEATGVRVKQALRACDYVFRLDGRELAVVLTTLKSPSDTVVVAERVCEEASFPYRAEGGVIRLSCNVGVSVFPDDGTEPGSMIQGALAAMNEARARNESCVIHDPELRRAAARKTRIRGDIRTALAVEQMEVRFQPVVDEFGVPVGAEALLRWNHPELGPLPPSYFLPIAEEGDESLTLGRWMLFRVCRYLREWSGFLDGRCVSVNLSAREIASPTLAEQVTRALEEGDIVPGALKLELTESQTLVDIESTARIVDHFAEQGIEVSLDGFGAGCSSLVCLKRLPVKEIKIDRRFIENLTAAGGGQDFLRGMVAMITSEGKTAFAKGVATRHQYELLRDMGIRRMQGFYFARPMSAERFVALLESRAVLPE